MYTRGLKHQSELKNKTKDSALWSYCQEYHDSVEVPFFMQQTGAFRDSLSRQIMEGVQINAYKGILLNRQSAWRQPAVSQARFVRGVGN